MDRFTQNVAYYTSLGYAFVAEVLPKVYPNRHFAISGQKWQGPGGEVILLYDGSLVLVSSAGKTGDNPLMQAWPSQVRAAAGYLIPSLIRYSGRRRYSQRSSNQ